MAQRYEMTGRIDALERLTNSYSGNPRWRVTLVTSGTGDYSRHTGVECQGDHLFRDINTASDASVNYEIGNKGLRVDDVVTVTMNGRGTITHMRPATVDA